MDTTNVDQADRMYKNLINLRQSLNRCDEEDLETVEIYDVSYAMRKWMTGYGKSVSPKTKTRGKRKEKREDRIKQEQVEEAHCYVSQLHN